MIPATDELHLLLDLCTKAYEHYNLPDSQECVFSWDSGG